MGSAFIIRPNISLNPPPPPIPEWHLIKAPLPLNLIRGRSPPNPRAQIHLRSAPGAPIGDRFSEFSDSLSAANTPEMFNNTAPIGPPTKNNTNPEPKKRIDHAHFRASPCLSVLKSRHDRRGRAETPAPTIYRPACWSAYCTAVGAASRSRVAGLLSFWVEVRHAVLPMSRLVGALNGTL